MEKWQLDKLNDVYEHQVLPELLEKAVGEMSVKDINGLIREYRHNDKMMDILLDELPIAIEREKVQAHTIAVELTDSITY